MVQPLDRATEDLGNIVHLEHVNVRVPDQQIATIFYLSGLGLTRDPYLMTGIDNMWANVGRSQFHLPTGAPQVVRGVTGLVLPDRESLLRRLVRVREPLRGTEFDFREGNDHVLVVSPWGNRIRVHSPARPFGLITLGIPYVAFEVPRGTSDGIVRFYREVFSTPASIEETNEGKRARVLVGADQFFLFEECDRPLPRFDGHHVQIYIANFSEPYRWLLERGLVSQEDGPHQWRFEQIVDPADGGALFEVEHEVRSLRHPFFNRQLVNRNPDLTNRNYAPEHESLRWALAEAG